MYDTFLSYLLWRIEINILISPIYKDIYGRINYLQGIYTLVGDIHSHTYDRSLVDDNMIVDMIKTYFANLRTH